MTCRQTGNSDYVNIVFCGLFGNFFRCLKKGPNIHIETQIGKDIPRGFNNWFSHGVVPQLEYSGAWLDQFHSDTIQLVR